MISIELKSVDVSSKFVNLADNIIEGYMCLAVFVAIHVVYNVIGKFLDAPCVVCQCHGISLKRPVRHRKSAN